MLVVGCLKNCVTFWKGLGSHKTWLHFLAIFSAFQLLTSTTNPKDASRMFHPIFPMSTEILLHFRSSSYYGLLKRPFSILLLQFKVAFSSFIIYETDLFSSAFDVFKEHFLFSRTLWKKQISRVCRIILPRSIDLVSESTKENRWKIKPRNLGVKLLIIMIN